MAPRARASRTACSRPLSEPADHATLALEAFERGQAEIAAGNGAAARRWLDRACRLAPRDQTLLLALATACLGHDDMRAAAIFATISAENDVREAWLGLATARRRLGDAAGAAAALATALRRHVPDTGFAALADAIAREADAPGWCGLSGDGAVTVRPTPGPLPLASSRKGRGKIWVTARDGRHFLGSPIDAAAITAAVGCVSGKDGGLTGWAWHPGDPNVDAVLTIRPARGRGRITLTASDTEVRIDNSGLLGRPRGFTVPAAALRGLSGLLHVEGRDGRDLLGSPLDPRAELKAGAAAADMLARVYPAARSPSPRPIVPAAIPVAAMVAAVPRAASRRQPPVDVVVPVHGGAEHTLACLDSVLASLRRPSRLIVIDDASPEDELTGALDALAAQRRITLIRHRRNLGFTASANDGMRAAAGRDVVLLNSDTLVAPGWLKALREVAHGAADIGTVTPFSNDATILSYPDPAGGNDLPDLADTARLDDAARLVNGGGAIDLPVGVGFCMYIRRACLDAVGLFRADLFAQGYGEENDFCLRARHLGWRHVAATGVFVAHIGGQSFGTAARHLRARNAALLERLHPGYDALIRAYIRADPLAAARRRLDLARWRSARRRGSHAVILITHASGGGVERQIADSVEQHREGGSRAIVLRPSRSPDGARCVTVGDGATNAFPNLRYVMPDELPDLLRLLTRERPRAVELHHLVGHHPAVLDLVGGLGVPYDIHVHDYAWLCGRVALVGPAQRYCGEPAVAQCEACVADAGNLIDEEISVAALRRRSAKLLAGARRVVVPSEDAAARIRRHFPATRPVVRPHENDAALGDPPRVAATKTCRVCVIGAIGIHKGYQVVLDCARDAAERRLPLEFVVVGHTIDDRRLLATGRVFVTGSYAADEVVALIKSQNATLAMLPSIFPETWCLSLAEAWRAGLRVLAFDIGAQAERIRRTGRGILLPLGSPARVINNALLAAAGVSRVNDSDRDVAYICGACPIRRVSGSIPPGQAPSRKARPQMSEAGTVVPKPAAAQAAPRDGGMQNRVAELKVSGHLMTLDTGVFQAPGTPAANDWSGLPGVRISLPPGPAGRPDAISISTFRDDGWMNGSDTATLIRVAEGPAQVLVTVYQSLSAPPETAPRLQVMRLGGDTNAPAAMAGQAAPGAVRAEDADVVAHVQRSGDIAGKLGDWVGTRGSQQWIEGFSLAPHEGVKPADVEYQAVLGRGWLSPWIEGGKFCGSRGMALPLLGLKIRLKANVAKTHECSYAATFVDGSSVGPIPGGEICEAESLAALEAFQVTIHRRGGEPAPRGTRKQASKPAPAKPAARPARQRSR